MASEGAFQAFRNQYLEGPTRASYWMAGGPLHRQVATLAGWNARLGQSYLGRSLQMSVAETAGFTYSRAFGIQAASEGFLGLQTSLGSLSELAAKRGGEAYAESMMGSLKSLQAGRPYMALGKSIGATMRHAGIKGSASFVAGTAFRGLTGPAATLYFAYHGGIFTSGYKKGGILGGAASIGETVLLQTAFRAVGGAIFNPFTLTVVAGAAAGYGIYQFGEAAKEHVKSLNRLEFGGGQIMDAIGSAGAATMRQRSVMALQDTHLNGRMAMGNEALLMHTSFR